MFKELIPQVITIAERAGSAIMEIYQLNDVDVTHKSDQSPLTLADSTASKIIEDGLQKITPDWPIISEESSIFGYQERKEWNCFWLVDPLDGTKEFINKNGEFTVNIALIKNGQPVLGVVLAPAIDQCYFASKGQGAFLKNQRKTKQIQSKNVLSEPATIAVSRSHIDKNTKKLIERIKNPEIIYMGSSLKVCLVAEGRIDCYPRLGPTMEWDTAAAHCIINEAGGQIVDKNGDELRYNKAHLENPYFISTNNYQRAYWLELCKVELSC